MPAVLTVKKAEKFPHDRTPLFDRGVLISGFPLRDGFAVSGKWFRVRRNIAFLEGGRAIVTLDKSLRSYLDVFGRDYPTKDGTGIRDYIHVSDLVNAHSCALSYLRNGSHGFTLNCGYGRGYSVLEVIAAVERAAGGPFPVRLCERRPGDAAIVVADPSRLNTTLNWKPKFDDLDTIARQAVAWEREIHLSETNRRPLSVESAPHSVPNQS